MIWGLPLLQESSNFMAISNGIGPIDSDVMTLEVATPGRPGLHKDSPFFFVPSDLGDFTVAKIEAGFPMVFPWFFYVFFNVFQWFFHGFPWFSHSFLT